jgi:N-succinyl-L-ornithine transcarbamylase
MNHFLSVTDCPDPSGWAREAIELKENPYQDEHLGKHKTLGLVFFNPSLRTRMSTIKAAHNLGMKVISLNVSDDSWQLEFEDGVVMNEGKAEHIKEAAAVMGGYCDLLGVRSFPGLQNREEDYADKLIAAFKKHAGVSVFSLESATLHPLQSLADLITIEEHKKTVMPRVVLTWAPHVKALPQAVPNSFAQWMNISNVDFVITHPRGLELSTAFRGNATIEHDQDKALANADFVYVKNWSSYEDYGKVINAPGWQINLKKLAQTNNAKLMHCLPVRRNVVIADEALDSDHSIIQQQAINRLYSAQLVLKKLLESL